MSKPLRVLIVEDSEDDALLTIRELKKGGYGLVYERVETAEAMGAALLGENWDVILCDYQPPQFSGLAAIALLKGTDIDIPLIIVSGAIGEETAVECMRSGARDYIMKGNLSRLVPAVEREMRETESRVQRRRAEEAQGESEIKYRQLFESIEDIYYRTDLAGTIEIVSPSIFNISGWTPDELIGKPATDLCADASDREKLLAALSEHSYVRDFGITLKDKQGRHKPSSVSARLIFDAHGIPKGIAGTIRDITARKQMEEKLCRSEENFRHSLDESPLGVRIVTIEGETIYANRAILDIYGYDSLDQLKTTPVEKRYTPESYADYLIRKEKRQQGVDVPSEYEISIVRKDSKVRHLQVFRKEILWNGERQFQVIYQDITECKRAEEALQKSEAKWRSLVSHSPDFIALHDREGRFLFLNHCAEGFTEKGVLGKKAYEFVSQESREIYRTAFKECIRTMTKQRAEYSAMGDSAKARMYESVFVPIIFQGHEINIMVVAKDITERKQAEEARLESEIRYLELFEHMGSGVAVYETRNNGEDFIFRDYNTAAERLDKTPRGQVIGRSAVDVFPRVKDFGLFDVFQRVYRTGKPERHPATFYKDEKISGWRENYVYKLPSGEIVSVFEDITERKRMEEALYEANVYNRSLIDASLDPLVTIGADGKIMDVNSATEAVTGYTRTELIGTEFSNYFTEPGKARAGYQEVFRVGSICNHPLEIQHRDGHVTSVLYNASVYRNEKEQVAGVFAAARDVTDRKRTEEELKTSRSQLRALAVRLQQIREEEGVRIAREIHDDMGGGLTGLKMDLSRLLHTMCGADLDEMRVALEDRIHTCNELIDSMIHVVRRISTDLRPSVLEDLGLIAALEWQLSEFTSRSEIPHEFTTPLEYINMDEDTAVAVFRIFQEALTNVARHARAKKVAVVLRESQRSLSGDETLILEIRDNGRGITGEEILNPESLGLLGMKERVLAFGGEISIRGEPGGGTTLELKIPLIKG